MIFTTFIVLNIENITKSEYLPLTGIIISQYDESFRHTAFVTTDFYFYIAD